MEKNLADYIKNGCHNVQGWLMPTAINVIVELSRLQNQLDIKGSMCEIGVHHGKLFILLHLLTDRYETSVSWDLFERQEENIDRSGCGDKDILLENLRLYKCDLGRVKVIAENSLNLTEANILSDCGDKVRIFSIDGGHTAEITYNDLSLARKTLCDGGIIILDDFFNERWPGVAEGTCKYLFSEGISLFPVVIAGNKFIFTNNKSIANTYIDGLKKFRKRLLCKESTVFGNRVLIISPYRRPLRAYLANTELWRSIRNQPVGKAIRVFRGR
jgi:hypothetical protein